MADRREKNIQWYVRNSDGSLYQDGAQLAVLMDIRDELQTLNRILNCASFLAVPHVLRGIRRNTTRPKRRKPAAAKGARVSA